ncbi:hypothetical protein KP509_39G023100 [Ceratopteris richardii]|uniref:Uncharacterized protein n=1 Tax=Ceratopteris richardii TaxID=49495 RepID=A0A8T2PZK3_CERRI|nr:hypothetical protein KP509_39G023100 [Ceratopteris richardii]
MPSGPKKRKAAKRALQASAHIVRISEPDQDAATQSTVFVRQGDIIGKEPSKSPSKKDSVNESSIHLISKIDGGGNCPREDAIKRTDILQKDPSQHEHLAGYARAMDTSHACANFVFAEDARTSSFLDVGSSASEARHEQIAGSKFPAYSSHHHQEACAPHDELNTHQTGSWNNPQRFPHAKNPKGDDESFVRSRMVDIGSSCPSMTVKRVPGEVCHNGKSQLRMDGESSFKAAPRPWKWWSCCGLFDVLFKES